MKQKSKNDINLGGIASVLDKFYLDKAIDNVLNSNKIFQSFPQPKYFKENKYLFTITLPSFNFYRNDNDDWSMGFEWIKKGFIKTGVTKTKNPNYIKPNTVLFVDENKFKIK